MIMTLFALLVAAIIIVILVYVAQKFTPPAPSPIFWIVWGIVFLVALVLLLPIGGVHINGLTRC